jgi:hypothetical protein
MATSETWVPLSYGFETLGPAEVEFVCEFRGATGRGLFDAGSLKLRKLPNSPPAEPRIP